MNPVSNYTDLDYNINIEKKNVMLIPF